MNKVTTILNVYKRLPYLEDQLQSIRNQTVPTDIWIDYTIAEGNEFYDLTEFGPDLKINAHINQNLYHFGRFYYALNVKTPYVFICDDDIIPGEKYIENCIREIEENGDCLLGGYGLVLDPKENKYKPLRTYGWCSITSGGIPKTVDVDFVGHCWFIKTEYLKYIAYEQPLTHLNGEDMHFSYMLQKHANIPVKVISQDPRDPSGWICDPRKGMRYGTDKHATSVRKDHLEFRHQIVEHQRKKGWKLLSEEK